MNQRQRLAPWCLALAFCAIAHVNAAELASLQPVGTYSIEEDELVYTQADGLELRARTYRPKLSSVLPAVIDIHGGAWSSGDRNSGQLYDRDLASTGLYVFAIDFRQAPAFKHPAANQDITAAVRYLRAQAKALRIDADSLGLIGSSSGGHLAMVAGLMPNATQFQPASAHIDSSVSYVVALWPVSNPAYRYDYAKRVGRSELIKSHDAYFGSREQMEQASVPGIIRAKAATHFPALLVVQPGKDANIPREMTFDLINAYQDAGGRVEYLFYPNQPHAFGHRPSADTNHLVVAMRDFIARTIGR